MPDEMVEMLAEGVIKHEVMGNVMFTENIIVVLIVSISWIVVSIIKR